MRLLLEDQTFRLLANEGGALVELVQLYTKSGHRARINRDRYRQEFPNKKIVCQRQTFVDGVLTSTSLLE